MNWMDDTQKAINYIENNLLESISVGDVANYIHSSPDYFARVFNIVTGISISEYIRNRRLTLAGAEIVTTQAKVIDVALKYGYDSPDSFAKAFMRFHGVTPAAAKTSDVQLKHFHPVSIKISIQGGFNMNKNINPVETLVETIEYEGVIFEIIERPIVTWVGSMGFNKSDYNADPSPLVGDVHPLWGEFFQNEIINVPPPLENFIAPTAIGVLWFNLKNPDLPNGMMMAKEVYTEKYDSKYDVYIQPAGLYIRLKVDGNSARLVGKDKCEPHELHTFMTEVAASRGYEMYYPVVDGNSLANLEYHDEDIGFTYTYHQVRKA